MTWACATTDELSLGALEPSRATQWIVQVLALPCPLNTIGACAGPPWGTIATGECLWWGHVNEGIALNELFVELHLYVGGLF